MTTVQEPLAWAILRALAQAQGASGGDGGAEGMSLPRLGKRLDQGVSVLMRELTLMSDATVGGQRGPGWVRVVQADDRWTAHLTEEGWVVAQGLLAVEAAP